MCVYHFYLDLSVEHTIALTNANRKHVRSVFTHCSHTRDVENIKLINEKIIIIVKRINICVSHFLKRCIPVAAVAVLFSVAA